MLFLHSPRSTKVGATQGGTRGQAVHQCKSSQGLNLGAETSDSQQTADQRGATRSDMKTGRGKRHRTCWWAEPRLHHARRHPGPLSLVLPHPDLHPECTPAHLSPGHLHLSHAQNILVGALLSFCYYIFLYYEILPKGKSIENDIICAHHQALSNPNILLHICFRYIFLKSKLHRYL